MLWYKQGKLLKNKENRIIDCGVCPCGIYGVYGFKYRYLNDKMQPVNQCRWYFDLDVYKLNELKLIPPFLYSDYISIAQGTGLVASGRGSFDCYQQWIDTDENGNDVYQTYCENIQYQVYCLLFSSDLQQFTNNFFESVADVAPNSNTGLYPNIFYSDGDLTSEGVKGRKYWENYFISRYSISYRITTYNGTQNWNLWSVSSNYYEQTGNEYSISTAFRTTGNNTGTTLDSKEISIDNTMEIDLTCDQVMTACQNNTPQLVEYMKSKINDKQQYFKYTTNVSSSSSNCNKSDYLCKDLPTIQGYCWDNFYCSQYNCSYKFNAVKVKIQRNENTLADASGIVFDCVINNQKWDDNNKESTLVKTQTTHEISVYFDTEFDQFPLPVDVTYMQYISYNICNPLQPYDFSNGELWVIPDYQAPRYCGQQVHGQCFRQKYDIKLIAKRYI